MLPHFLQEIILKTLVREEDVERVYHYVDYSQAVWVPDYTVGRLNIEQGLANKQRDTKTGCVHA